MAFTAQHAIRNLPQLDEKFFSSNCRRPMAVGPVTSRWQPPTAVLDGIDAKYDLLQRSRQRAGGIICLRMFGFALRR